MPVNTENKETLSKDIKEKVEALGSGMIMHDVRADEATKESMQNLQDELNNASEADADLYSI